jgi:hypothetical protein
MCWRGISSERVLEKMAFPSALWVVMYRFRGRRFLGVFAAMMGWCDLKVEDK